MRTNFIRVGSIRSALLPVLGSLLASSCVSRTVFLDGHRPFPSNPSFSTSPQMYTHRDLSAKGIRTDGVYVRIGYRPQDIQAAEDRRFRSRNLKTGCPHYRFWPSGRVMIRTATNETMTAAGADSFERANVGYFVPTSDGAVAVELYVYDPGRGDYAVRIKTLKVEGDTLWSDTGRMHNGEPVQQGYRFVPIEGMTAQPDW